MKVLGIIPARYTSARLPGKMLEDLAGKPLIVRTYEAACKIKCLKEVVVVTDDPRIAQAVKDHGGLVWMSKGVHESSSDRIAEYIRKKKCDVVVNIPGDEPFISSKHVCNLVDAFSDQEVKVASLMKRITDEVELFNNDLVKVVCDKKNNALYFSRTIIPYLRTRLPNHFYNKHVGIFAYRRDALLKFSEWEIGTLEEAENLEQLRYLENGVKIRMVETTLDTISIDTAYDLEKANEYYVSTNGSFKSKTKRVQGMQTA
jgi:3-deoxy-manno-octulosonate cytidylyltransferase (CMP-KDO synthetase)